MWTVKINNLIKSMKNKQKKGGFRRPFVLPTPELMVTNVLVHICFQVIRFRPEDSLNT